MKEINVFFNFFLLSHCFCSNIIKRNSAKKYFSPAEQKMQEKKKMFSSFSRFFFSLKKNNL